MFLFKIYAVIWLGGEFEFAASQRRYCPVENDFLFARFRFKSYPLPIRPWEQLWSKFAPVPASQRACARVSLGPRSLPAGPVIGRFSCTFRTNRLCPWLPLTLCLRRRGAISLLAGSHGVLWFQLCDWRLCQEIAWSWRGTVGSEERHRCSVCLQRFPLHSLENGPKGKCLRTRWLNDVVLSEWVS